MSNIRDGITNSHGTEIRVGQVWADNDPRQGDRTFRIVGIEGFGYTRAVCDVLTDQAGNRPARPRTVRIKVDRLHPTSTGYRLIR